MENWYEHSSLFIDEPQLGNLSLGFDNYVESISDIIVNSRPQYTIGIYGEWGTGKSTLLKNIKQNLEIKQDCTCLDFDAWQYEQESTVMAFPLILSIIARIYEANKKVIDELDAEKPGENLKEKLSRIFRGLSLNMKFGIPGMGEVGLGYDFSKLQSKEEDKRGELSAEEYLERFYLEQTKLQEGVDVIKQLISNPKIKGIPENRDLKLVVFVDDLDRCSPDKAVEMFEVIKLFLGIKGIVYVMGLSNKIVQLVLDEKFKHLKGQFSAEEYLRKLIQLQFPIPKLKIEAARNYIDSLLDGHEVDDSKKFLYNNKELIYLGVEKNPRQIKRYLNNYILAYKIYYSKEVPSSQNELKEFLALNIFSQRWEWLYDIFDNDKPFRKKLMDSIKSNKYDPNDRIIRKVQRDSDLMSFLTGEGGALIFQGPRNEALLISGAKYPAAQLSSIQVVKAKLAEQEEEGKKESLISEFFQLDEVEQDKLWKQRKIDDEFAFDLGYSIGTRFDEIKSEDKKIVDKVTDSEAFATGLASSLGPKFETFDKQSKGIVLKFTLKSDLFARKLGECLAREPDTLVVHHIEDLMLSQDQNKGVLLEQLIANLGEKFGRLSDKSKKRLLEMVPENDILAKHLGPSVGQSFANLDKEIQKDVLKTAEENHLFAGKIAYFVGSNVVSLDEEVRQKALELSRNSESFRKELGSNQADFYFFTKDYCEAEKLYDELLKSNPSNYNARIKRSRALINLERFEDAKKEYEEAFNEGGTDPNSLSLLATAYARKGRADEADKRIREALELQKSLVILYNAACVKSLLNDKVGALEILEEVFKRDNYGHYRNKAPTDPDLGNLRGDPEFKKLLANNRVVK
jgi:Flp pilus assembly protein TadD